ncbi:methyltransferase domain-containing protein [Nitrosopumilus sp.]|uniref:methyltransferase domain-containing protein n=1 Tax=Nitrosopumilus sp. TaxID=2024843 RepID=UPI0026311725|nr:methyltransferase domain-containing protein [Nitrosopumilus sp.]
MHESSLKYLKCPRCSISLELEKLLEYTEIEEGFLHCKKCKLVFPIISKIPILWDDFSNYISSRKVLSGRLYRLATTKNMKHFLKSFFSNIKFKEDRTHIENRWTKIYQNSRKSKFYSTINKHIHSLPPSKLGVEYGCSIGIITSQMSKNCNYVFGIDRSFSALEEAKKSNKKNTDYVIADTFSNIFGKLNFELVVALNVLEIMEPEPLLKKISHQISNGTVIISDPYDFDRGVNSVKNPVDEKSIRQLMRNLGFKMTSKTKTSSSIPWNLKLHSRATLNYKVDLIIGRKSD